MISQTRQRFAMALMVAVAFLALAVGAVYQGDNQIDEPRVVGAETQSTVQSGGQAAAPGTSSTPIEAWLPQSGEASACREAVGVDLAPGFGAKLTINGIVIQPEQMNVNLDENGEISSVITASRSLGHYTVQPDDDCPNGSLLRAVDNLLEVCVYRLSDTSRACALRTENVFDAL